MRGGGTSRVVERMNSADLQPTLEPGRVVAGKYRIDRTLAEGGMGVIVAATHIHLDQMVALKFLRGDLGTEFDALARFTREARAAAQLRSEHVARVLDAGVTDDGTPYIAMEYLEGQSLARALQMHGPMDVVQAVEYVIQACEGLAEAHSRGIVHRDVKPYNLFLVERSPGWSAIKILDFGISKFAFSDASNVVTGVILGSPCYMSPEQLRSTATVDHRTDIWSVGTTLYELLAGRAAFDASQTLPALIAAILDRTAPDVREARPNVPAELSAVVARCLAKDREARFDSAGDLALALLPYASPRSRIIAELAASMRPAFPRRESGGANSDWPGHATAFRALPAALQEAPIPTLAPSNDRTRETGNPAASGPITTAPPGAPLEAEPPPTGVAKGTRRRNLRNAVAAGVVAIASVFAVREYGAKAPNVPVIPPPSQETTEAAMTPRGTSLPAVNSPPAAPPPGASAELGRIEVVVRASPSVARITVDDRPVQNPFVASFPKDGSAHRIAASAWGYDSKVEDVTFDADMILDLGLVRHTFAAHPVAAPPSEKRPASAGTVTESAAAHNPGTVSPQEVDSSGGRAPLRPIETKDPYGAQ